jgi:DNA-directed RNA polymerase I subunit RPA2
MERDSLLAHGVSFLLHDRLLNSSDYHTTYACSDCGSMLAAHAIPNYRKGDSGTTEKVTCRICKSGSGCSVIAIPFVFLYLVNELAAMNIRLTLDIK